MFGVGVFPVLPACYFYRRKCAVPALYLKGYLRIFLILLLLCWKRFGTLFGEVARITKFRQFHNAPFFSFSFPFRTVRFGVPPCSIVQQWNSRSADCRVHCDYARWSFFSWDNSFFVFPYRVILGRIKKWLESAFRKLAQPGTQPTVMTAPIEVHCPYQDVRSRA